MIEASPPEPSFRPLQTRQTTAGSFPAADEESGGEGGARLALERRAAQRCEELDFRGAAASTDEETDGKVRQTGTK